MISSIYSGIKIKTVQNAQCHVYLGTRQAVGISYNYIQHGHWQLKMYYLKSHHVKVTGQSVIFMCMDNLWFVWVYTIHVYSRSLTILFGVRHQLFRTSGPSTS